MHYSLLCTIFFLLIYNNLSEAAVCDAGRPTVLVLGHSDYNLLKIAFVERLVNDTVTVEKAFDEYGSAFSFLTFHSDESGTLDKHLNHHLVQATFLNTQTCTVSITTKGTDEMSLEELQTLREMIYYVNGGLIVIEIGNKATQTTVILEHSTFCWGTTTLPQIEAINTVLLCNDVKISETPLLNGLKIKTLFERDAADQLSVPTTTITWPSLFPSVMAADSAADKKARNSRKTIQKSARELYYKKGRKGAMTWPDDEPDTVDIDHLKKKEMKIACKYRKSCYETGILPNLHPEKVDVYPSDKEGEDSLSDDDNIDEDDTLALKVLCKYRPSCYAEIGMEMSEANQKKSKGIFIAKKTAYLETENRPKKKESIREIARKAVKEVEKKDSEDPKAKISVIEKHLTETEEKLEMKNRCKYRKSCYETGKVPEIEAYHAPTWLSYEPMVDYTSKYLRTSEDKDKPFEEKDEHEKKLHCKYRKSCYDTGIAPKIDQSQKFHFEEVVERAPAQIPLQLRCKYRKSCYETGIVPEIKKPVEPVDVKSKPFPTTVEDLKLYCKYRKSCYREKAREIEDQDNRSNDEVKNNERILVEEVTDDVPEQLEKMREEVVEEVPKKTHKTKERVFVPPSDEPKPKSKKAKKHPESKEENSVSEEDELPKKHKKAKPVVKEPEPPAPTPKKSKSRKSAEVVEPALEEPEHSTAFEMEEPEKSKNVVVEGMQEPEVPKKETKSKKPKKKLPKDDEEPSTEDQLEHNETETIDLTSVSKQEKLHCKYRKSCYATHVPPQIKNDPLVWHYKKNYLSMASSPPTPETEISEERWNQLNENERKLECKYRKSCYDSRKLPPIVTATDGIYHVKHVFAPHHTHVDPPMEPEVWQKRPESQRKLACKYRKSCFETGKLPEIKPVPIFASRLDKSSETRETSVNWAHKSEAERKIECKYRKSCYESGKLPPMSPATVETVIESIHDNPRETLQQRCKYRKSCYAAAAEMKDRKPTPETKSKPGIIDEDILVVKNVKTANIKKEDKSTEKDDNVETSAQDKKAKKADSKAGKKQKQKSSSSKKSKEKDDDDSSKEEEYMEIPQEEPSKPKINAAELAKNLTTEMKIACKYRQSCYLTAVTDHLPPEQIMKMRGVKCSKYRLSCREQLGLPPLIRAPIGPNGRKLCRKKKVEGA